MRQQFPPRSDAFCGILNVRDHAHYLSHLLTLQVVLITIGVFSVCNTLAFLRAPPPGIILVNPPQNAPV